MDSKVITTADVDLNVVEAGSSNQPCILFLHGFPDDHNSWAAQLNKLKSRFHVIAYDLRGVGQSIIKTEVDGAFTIEALLNDLQAVIAELVPADQKVHLVGHNWGAVIGWYAIQDSYLKTRIASFTSISGLHMGMLADWLKQQLVSLDINKTFSAIRQLAVSSYLGVFNFPMIERTFHWFPKQWMYLMARAGGLDSIATLAGAELEDDELEARLYPAVELFRQNLAKLSEEPLSETISTPVQIIIPTKDFLFDQRALKSVSAHLSNLKTVTITAGHWVHKTHAEEVSGLVSNFIGGIKITSPANTTKTVAKGAAAGASKAEKSDAKADVKEAATKSTVKKKAVKKKAAKKAVAKKSQAATQSEASVTTKKEAVKADAANQDKKNTSTEKET